MKLTAKAGQELEGALDIHSLNGAGVGGLVMLHQQRRNSLEFSLTVESNISHWGECSCHELTWCPTGSMGLWCFQKREQGSPSPDLAHLATSRTLSHSPLLLICIKKSFIWHLPWAAVTELWFWFLSQWGKHCKALRDSGVFEQCIKEHFGFFPPTASPLFLKVEVPSCLDSPGPQSQCGLFSDGHMTWLAGAGARRGVTSQTHKQASMSSAS